MKTFIDVRRTLLRRRSLLAAAALALPAPSLAQARPDQKAPGVIDPPKSPIKDHDVAIWSRILRGYQIATNTYETLPDTLKSSKLHCQSCHLDAGGRRVAC